MSAYFIKKIAITDKQAREHLAQAQRKSKEEETQQSMKTRDHKLATGTNPKSPHYKI
jgi:hypothetical protein